MKNSRVVTVPNYLKDFICDGSKCEDNCCTGNWNVDVDKKHYKELKKVSDIKLKDNIKEYLKINSNSNNNATYGILQQDSTLGRCAFLSEDKLCNIQLNIGSDYLCDVCMCYPRYTNNVNGTLERALTLSCPIAARMALLNKNGINFEEITENENSRKVMISDFSFKNEGIYKHINILRDFNMTIIKNRNYSIEERLIILGMFYDKLQKMQDEKKYDGLPKLISDYIDLAESNEFKKTLSKLPKVYTIQVGLLKELADERIMTLNKEFNVRYIECYTEMVKGLIYTEDKEIDEISETYKEVYLKWYKSYIDQREYIFENYLVNYMFIKTFPFIGTEKVFDNYVMMILKYSLMKMHLIGMAGYYKEGFNEEHIIKLIQSFEKVVEHSPKFIEHMYKLITDNNLNTLSYMCVLVNS